MMRLAALSWALGWSLLGPVFAAEQILTLDPEATEITFALEATGHSVQGRLFLESGEIRFDLETGAVDGEVVADAPKTVTGNKRRDRTMHNKVLESERFPSIVFRVTGVEGKLSETGVSELTLDGMMAIHGEEHPVSVPVRVEKDNGRILVRASLVVPYVEWGLHRPSVLFLKVAPEVEVRIEARATLAPAAGSL